MFQFGAEATDKKWWKNPEAISAGMVREAERACYSTLAALQAGMEIGFVRGGLNWATSPTPYGAFQMTLRCRRLTFEQRSEIARKAATRPLEEAYQGLAHPS